MAYTPDSIWRNRDTFLEGRPAIVEFLKNKWSRENGYRLRKELFAFTDNKVSRYSMRMVANPKQGRCPELTFESMDPDRRSVLVRVV